MPALPASSAFTGSAVTEAQFKTAITDQREFLAGLLGTPGTQASALTAMGALLNSTTAKTTTYGVVAGDRGKLIDCTSGTFSLTLLAATTAGDGFTFGVRNSGTGVITLDPNASEQIDGATTITLAAGESCLVVCNGSAWKTIRSQKFKMARGRYLYSGTTYTRPSDVGSMYVMVLGATGGVSNGSATAGGGVGGGGYSQKYYASPAASYSFACGAAGTTSGTAGGTTTFDVMSVTGSGGVGSNVATGGAGGVGSGGDFNATGGAGGGRSHTSGGGGGGGAGAGRAGAGFSGGAGGTVGGAGGGGGGTGGVGGTVGASTSVGVGGIAATSLSAPAIPGADDTTFMFTPGSPGSPGNVGNGDVTGGNGGLGASGNEMLTYWGIAQFSGAPGGVGGKGAQRNQNEVASSGSIFILEFSA